MNGDVDDAGPALITLREALRHKMKSLMIQGMLHRHNIDFETLLATLRIEASIEFYMEVERGLYWERRMGFPLNNAVWPVEVNGVAIYEVRGIPEPGWRIISPLEGEVR